MSTTFFIYMPKRNEYISVGRTVGWGNQRSAPLGALVLAAIAHCPEGGAMILSQEDYDYDQTLCSAKDVTDEFLDPITKLKQTSEGREMSNNDVTTKLFRYLTSSGIDVLDLASGSEVKLGAIASDKDRLRKIAETVMSHKREIIQVR